MNPQSPEGGPSNRGERDTPPSDDSGPEEEDMGFHDLFKIFFTNLAEYAAYTSCLLKRCKFILDSSNGKHPTNCGVKKFRKNGKNPTISAGN